MRPGDQMLELRYGASLEAQEIMTSDHPNFTETKVILERSRCEMPPVQTWLRRALWQMHPLLFAVWELQDDGTFRWHIYKHWSSGRLDRPTHVTILKSPEGGYAPLDEAVIGIIWNILQWTNEPYKAVEEMLLSNERKRLKTQEETADRIKEGWKYTRRLFARLAWGTVGNLWERGIQLPYRVDQPRLKGPIGKTLQERTRRVKSREAA